MSERLTFLVEQIKEAKAALEESILAADRLGLNGSQIELQRALSNVNGVLWAIEVKEEAEFAAYRTETIG